MIPKDIFKSSFSVSYQIPVKTALKLDSWLQFHFSEINGLGLQIQFVISWSDKERVVVAPSLLSLWRYSFIKCLSQEERMQAEVVQKMKTN